MPSFFFPPAELVRSDSSLRSSDPLTSSTALHTPAAQDATCNSRGLVRAGTRPSRLTLPSSSPTRRPHTSLAPAQINCTYYSAVGDNDAWYLLARAIQLFSPGIPLIYYVGLLAGRNDIDLVERTKTGRDINRHPYSLDEAISETKRPVVKARVCVSVDACFSFLLLVALPPRLCTRACNLQPWPWPCTRGAWPRPRSRLQ
jgi:hypothetical protein